MRDITKYIEENSKEYIENMCRCCSKKTDKRLTHKETKKKYPFCQDCIEKGFFNKNIFDVVE